MTANPACRCFGCVTMQCRVLALEERRKNGGL